MAHKIKKVKAFKLFSKGWNPPEVAAQVDVNLRSIQRWYQEFLQQNPDFAMVGKVPVTVTPVDEIPTSAHLAEVVEDTAKHDLSFSQDWVAWANSLTDSHLAVHGQIREKLAKMLNACLDSAEFNTRAIQVLSQCLCRHLEAERRAGFADMLVADKAFQKVESLGYEIFRGEIKL